MFSTTQKGSYGEEIACSFLQSKNFTLIKKNWRYKNHFEIDILMYAPNQQLVGVEVRSHNSLQEYKPFESLDKQKLMRIKNALEIFARIELNTEPPMRIDVVSVVIEPLEIEHFESVDLIYS